MSATINVKSQFCYLDSAKLQSDTLIPGRQDENSVARCEFIFSPEEQVVKGFEATLSGFES